MCKEITSDEVARTAVIISATTKTPAVAAASEAATRAPGVAAAVAAAFKARGLNPPRTFLKFSIQFLQTAWIKLPVAQHTRRLQARQNEIKFGCENNIAISNFLPKICIKRRQFFAKFGWDKSQPSLYVPPGLGATEGNGAQQRRH